MINSGGLLETPISKSGASSTFTEVYSAVMSVLYEFFFVFTACKICNIDHTALLAKEEQQMHSIQKQTRLINCDGCSCICTLRIFTIITIQMQPLIGEKERIQFYRNQNKKQSIENVSRLSRSPSALNTQKQRIWCGSTPR